MRKMDRINVLMCGGRRIGKTSIMSAIQRNVQEQFPEGNIVLTMENSAELIKYGRRQAQLFDSEYDQATYIASTNDATSSKSEYNCKVVLKDRKSNLELCFTDIPGEWFIDVTHEEELIRLIRNSQVLIIAIDSPHLMEKDGHYHEVYNRATILTDEIKRAFQGNCEQRMVLFAPLKCERYKNRRRMEELLENVKTGYEDLIAYLCDPNQQNLYTVAVTPVITMGGLEFLRFNRPVNEDGELVCDNDGQPLEAVSVNPSTGRLEMNWPAEYLFLQDSFGDHYYAPEDCEQPLTYVLLFLIGIGRQRQTGLKGILQGLWTVIRRLPDQKIMEDCKQELLDKRNADPTQGFDIINDPMQMLN